MTTEFNLPHTDYATARKLFGDWSCRIERMSPTSVNIVFFDQDEWNRFERFCEENGIEYSLV